MSTDATTAMVHYVLAELADMTAQRDQARSGSLLLAQELISLRDEHARLMRTLEEAMATLDELMALAKDVMK